MLLNVKKSFALIFTIIYMFTFLPVSAVDFLSSSEDSASSHLLWTDFENPDSEALWSGGIRDAVAAYEGENGYMVTNPFGDINSDIFGHILEYGDTIELEEGKFYTFSAYIMNPLADDLTNPSTQAYINSSTETLYIDISSVGFDWTYVTASFTANEDMLCKPLLSLYGGDMDLGFFVDDICIREETKLPVYTLIDGPDSVFIPASGAKTYRYSIAAYDADDHKVNVLMDSYSFETTPLPDGIEFDEEMGILTVFPHAPENFEITLKCSASVIVPLQSSEKTFTTTRNLLSDPSFENGEELWYSDSELNYVDSTVSLFAKEDGTYGKYTSMTYSPQLMLYEGEMYVFRADVRSEEEFPSSYVYISNLSFAQSGYAEINITGIGGGWTRVTSAFLVEDTGLYDLTITLSAPTERPIFVDNVYLGREDEAATDISIHAPGNICLSEDVVILPCYANVLNQMGVTMESLDAEISLSPQNEGVYFADGEIIVEPGAKRCDYTITATYEDITSSLTFTVSDDCIGDGGFEEKVANEWWTSSEGSLFSIIDYDGDLSAYVYSKESSCIVINNSYMSLPANEYFVFSLSADYGDCTVTAFIDDVYSGEYVPFAMFNPQTEGRIPFSVDQSVFGRLLLYIESENDEFGFIFDDVSITPCELSASEIIISDGGYGGFLKGSYNYINNMTDDPTADISTTRWYISSSFDGHYEPIGIPNQNYLEYTPDMIGQFVIFEVTPICAYSGLVSESLRSLPVQVGTDEKVETEQDKPLSALSPIELENNDSHPFIDITGHWSEKMVSSLFASGIVSGKSTTRFKPDDYVTRAEFTAMVTRAFSLVSIPYSDQFDDVSASDWHSGWIEAAYRRGIVNGTSENTFDPNGYITREQMAAIIYRIYTLCDGPMPYEMELRYDDAYMISPWSYEAVKTTTNLNLFQGKEMNLFKPLDKTTRAEAAAVIYRTLDSFY